MKGKRLKKLLVYYVLLARNLDFLSYDWYTKSVWQLELLSICTLYLQSHLIRKRYFNWYNCYEVQISICCPIWFQASSPDIAEVESFTKQFEDVFKVRGQWVGDYPWKKGILVSHEMMLAILDEEI